MCSWKCSFLPVNSWQKPPCLLLPSSISDWNSNLCCLNLPSTLWQTNITMENQHVYPCLVCKSTTNVPFSMSNSSLTLGYLRLVSQLFRAASVSGGWAMVWLPPNAHATVGWRRRGVRPLVDLLIISKCQVFWIVVTINKMTYVNSWWLIFRWLIDISTNCPLSTSQYSYSSIVVDKWLILNIHHC